MDVSTRSPHLYALMSKGKLIRLKKGAQVGSTGEGHDFMMVVKGYVKRYMILSDGSIGVQIIYGEHDVFSFTKAYRKLLGQSIYDGPETYYYKTMTDTNLLAIDLELLKEAVQNEPVLYQELFSEAGAHLKTCVHIIENISLGNSYARVAHQLHFMAGEYGEKTSAGVKLKIPVTHQDMADILGTTRETVTLAMMKLRDKGLLGNSRHMVVTSMKRLAKEAYA